MVVNGELIYNEAIFGVRDSSTHNDRHTENTHTLMSCRPAPTVCFINPGTSITVFIYLVL